MRKIGNKQQDGCPKFRTGGNQVVNQAFLLILMSMATKASTKKHTRAMLLTLYPYTSVLSRESSC
jgi:hypothetical protein